MNSEHGARVRSVFRATSNGDWNRIQHVFPLIFGGLLVTLPVAAQEPEGPAPDHVELGGSTPPATENGPSSESPPAPPAAPAKEAPAPSPVTPETKPDKPPANEGALTNVSGPAIAKSDDSWKFEYHGYIRAPMRLGVGNRKADPAQPANSTGTSFHAPVIPDDQYFSWQSSPHNKTDWAELYISLGNSWAKGTVSIQGYDFYQGSFANTAQQLGVTDGFVDLTPDFGLENFRLALRVGAFSNKYGTAGRYDAGEYDTYMFGRIHNIGEALHVDYDLDAHNTLWIEHGVGAKKPDPSQDDNARFTLLNHAHVGFSHDRSVEISAHYLDSWTSEEVRTAAGVETGGFITPQPAGTLPASSVYNVPDGRMWVAGLDGRFDLGAFGYLYAAYSHVGLEHALTVARAIDVIHASGGGELGLGAVDNYLGLSCVDNLKGVLQAPKLKATPASSSADDQALSSAVTEPCSQGNGHIDTLLAQYELSLTNFRQQISGGPKFDGEGADLYLKLYGMYNQVHSDVALTDGIHKLKYGADLAWSLTSWLTAAVRADRLQPNSRVPEQSFSILSPRLVFRSKWISREAVTIQYSRYFYDQRTCATGNPANATYEVGEERCVQPPSAPVSPTGFGATIPASAAVTNLRYAPTTLPDENVFKIEATMWW